MLLTLVKMCGSMVFPPKAQANLSMALSPVIGLLLGKDKEVK